MVQDSPTLSRAYLRRHCPLAWNTPERRDVYARLGFDMVGEAFRLIQEYLGKDQVAPGDLPIRIEMHFSVQAADGPPVIRVAKRQSAEIASVPDATPCGPSEDKPALSAQYLEEHMPTSWDDERMRDAYATLGYAVEREAIFRLIEEPTKGNETIVPVHVTVDTTWTAGGCALVCCKGVCAHQTRR